ncbi:Uma2 family endonuclease [Cronbergia sp. UHCC 0137]|uniref:Uma2 family endonuclease n=1 Tax=Cronbergia sp. UHCC 0137 TaxID=3110239 RepID=UPI002B1F2B1D|nr:Uma2 family endonuclease [Cronbergia sp. UHCC 0137]MEA5619213.1 Uma2 family endonuclease [Cronbergia sp. UHCC 0137]
MLLTKPIQFQKDVIFPPGDLESDEPPLESDLHLRQIILLLQCLELWWQNRNDYYAAGNLTVYYSPRQRKSEHFRGPDFFVVLDTERKPRKTWVVWEENGKYPNIIIELLSDSTSSVDRGLKKQIYQDTFRTSEYFGFDPYNLEFVGFILINGIYQPIEPNPQGWLWSHQLGLFLGVHENKLRYFTTEGGLVPTPQEFAEQETQRAQSAIQLAEQEKQKVEVLKAKLRELNIDPGI